MDFLKAVSLVLAVCITTSGCSAFRSSTQTISVTTDQADAEIYINGTLAGKGTAHMPVKRNQNVLVLAKKDGYIPISRSIGKGFSTTGVLDLIGGFLIVIPFFGLMAPGAYSLDEENISIMMIEN